MEPRMLMKNKHLNAESKGRFGLFPRVKSFKINQLEISAIGYQNDSENEGISQNVIENKRPKMDPWGITQNVHEK